MPAAHSGGDRNTGRPRRWKAAGLAAAGAAAVLFWLCSYTVYTGEYALVTEFGKPVQVVTTPGLRFKFPYQSVRTFDARLFAYAPASTEFLTLEKTPVVAASTMLWRISDPKKFFQTVFDRAGAESRLGDILFAELGAAVGRNPLARVRLGGAGRLSGRGHPQRRSPRSAVRSRCAITASTSSTSSCRTFDFPKQNRLPLYARMKSERGRISMKYRSEGEEEGLKIRAAAEQEKTGIVSDALKLAQQQRGEGEGKAAQIYVAGAVPGARVLPVRAHAWKPSRNLVPKGTTLVLPADSELFGLLKDSATTNALPERAKARKVTNKRRKE